MIQRICKHCSARPVNCQALLSRTAGNLHRLLEPRPQQLMASSQSQNEHMLTNSSIGDRMRFLPTDLESLDNNGEGGIRIGSVTEVAGRAGVGKTQFALQLVIMAAKYNQSAIYIDTEGKLVLDRLKDMASTRYSEFTRQKPDFHKAQSNQPVSLTTSDEISFDFKDPNEMMENLIVKEPHSTAELLAALDSAEEEILHRNQRGDYPVRLLIVDSIASPLKRDFGPNAIPQRAATAFSIAQTLKRYAEQMHLAVIVINQVGLDSQSETGGTTDGLRHDQVAVRASLGTSWHHCVSTRILIDHEVDPHRIEMQRSGIDDNNVRILSVVKSNWMPNITLSMELAPLGMMQVKGGSQGTSTEPPLLCQ